MVGSNVKVRSDVILVLPNVTMKLSNVRKTVREPLNVTKVPSNVMLVLLNMTMEPSNVTKEQLHVILKLYNVRMEPLNMRRNKGIIICDKKTVKFDLGNCTI